MSVVSEHFEAEYRQFLKTVKAARGKLRGHALDVIETIKANASQGKGYHGTFVPYAPRTQKYKKRARPVTLCDERHGGSHMMNAMKVVYTDSTKEGDLKLGVQIHVAGERHARIWGYHVVGAGRLPKREPGLTDWQRRKMREKVGISVLKMFDGRTKARRDATILVNWAKR